jgi:hypothetical protein
MAHENLRMVNRWGSYGKNGDQELKFRFIYEISDNHLANIIPFVRNNIIRYGQEWLNFLIDEVEYRRVHNISVPNYIEDMEFTFLK